MTSVHSGSAPLDLIKIKLRMNKRLDFSGGLMYANWANVLLKYLGPIWLMCSGAFPVTFYGEPSKAHYLRWSVSEEDIWWCSAFPMYLKVSKVFYRVVEECKHHYGYKLLATRRQDAFGFMFIIYRFDGISNMKYIQLKKLYIELLGIFLICWEKCKWPFLLSRTMLGSKTSRD